MAASRQRPVDVMAKKAFILRIDENILKAVEKWAADEFRSSNGQMEWIISEALKKAGRYKKDDDNKKEKEEEG